MGIKKDFQIVLINDIKIKEYKIENSTKSLFFSACIFTNEIGCDIITS